MSIINLNKRLTDQYNEYSCFYQSSDSLVYVKDKYALDKSGPDCLTLSVGDCWFDHTQYVRIDPKRGIKVKPHCSVVLETSEEIAVPLNVYGLIFGAGSNIYNGGFISSGKIDPGFAGKLRIGYHNGSERSVTLRISDKLAYAIFFDTESELESAPFPSSSPGQPAIERLPFYRRAWRWTCRNAFQLLSLLLAAAAVVVSVITSL